MAISSAFMAGRMAMTAAGLAQGAIISLGLILLLPQIISLQELPVTLLISGLIWTFIFQMVWNGKEVKRLFAISTIATSFYGIVCYYALKDADAPLRAGSLFGATMFSLILLLPFLQCWQDSGRFEFPYRRLCFFARDNNYLLLIAQLIAAFVAMFMYLWAALFESVGVDFFSHLFFSPEIAPAASCAALGLGLAIARERQRVREWMANAGVGIMHIFLPLIAAVLLVFVVVIPVHHWHEMMTGLRYPPLLMMMGLMALVAINSVYLDGTHSEFWQGWRKFFTVQIIAVFPAYGIMTSYMAWQKYHAYGLTVGRYWLMAAGLVMTCYALGYLLACVLQFNKGLAAIAPVNKIMALLIAIALPVSHITPLDAMSVSAHQQAGMLMSGQVKPDNFDYGYLYFRLGKAGQHQLDLVEKSFKDKPEYSIVQREMTFAAKSRNYWDWKFDWNIRKSQVSRPDQP